MPFQTQVNRFPAPGRVGTRASVNPLKTVVAGDGALVANVDGVIVGNFAFIDDASVTNIGGGLVASTIAGAATVVPKVPDGIVHDNTQAVITAWPGVGASSEATLVVPQGLPVTLIEDGDLFVKSVYGPAARGDKAFANLFNGAVLAAAAGSFNFQQVGSGASVTGYIAGKVLNVTAVGSGRLEVGDLVQAAGVPKNIYITSLGTGTGGTGTYNLTDTATLGGASDTRTITITSPAGPGGAKISSADLVVTGGVMTVNTLDYGVLKVGMLLNGTGLAAGAYIAGLGSGAGGIGTYHVVGITSAESAKEVDVSPWIETDFKVLSPGQAGEIIKIGK